MNEALATKSAMAPSRATNCHVRIVLGFRDVTIVTTVHPAAAISARATTTRFASGSLNHVTMTKSVIQTNPRIRTNRTSWTSVVSILGTGSFGSARLITLQRYRLGRLVGVSAVGVAPGIVVLKASGVLHLGDEGGVRVEPG